MTKPARIVGWLLLAFVAFVTIGPIEVRPLTILGPGLERFLAYFLTALVLAYGYRGKKATVAVVVIGAAIVFEVAQHFVPTRDARIADSLVKIAGAVCGILAETLLSKTLNADRVEAEDP